jgi:cytochrome b pre-mRNA-processing protein 3
MSPRFIPRERALRLGKLDETGCALTPHPPLPRRRDDTADAAKLYGAIVAQARLAAFYQDFAVPDTLEGRFLVLSLHLFALLHRLKQEASRARGLAQALTDRFNADMETVLRELGVGDLSIPKKMRGLAASSAALLQAYEGALTRGEVAIADEIAKAFPVEPGPSQDATLPLAHYLMRVVRALEAQDLAALSAGEVSFPEPIPGMELGDDKHDKRD